MDTRRFEVSDTLAGNHCTPVLIEEDGYPTISTITATKAGAMK